jgi:hypothetical protein
MVFKLLIKKTDTRVNSQEGHPKREGPPCNKRTGDTGSSRRMTSWSRLSASSVVSHERLLRRFHHFRRPFHRQLQVRPLMMGAPTPVKQRERRTADSGIARTAVRGQSLTWGSDGYMSTDQAPGTCVRTVPFGLDVLRRSANGRKGCRSDIHRKQPKQGQQHSSVGIGRDPPERQVLPSPTEPTDAVGRSPDETLAWKGGYRKGYDNISGLSIENSRGLGASSRKRVVQSNALSKRAKDVYLCRQHAPICARSKTAPLPVAIACGADAPAVRMGDP